MFQQKLTREKAYGQEWIGFVEKSETKAMSFFTIKQKRVFRIKSPIQLYLLVRAAEALLDTNLLAIYRLPT